MCLRHDVLVVIIETTSSGRRTGSAQTCCVNILGHRIRRLRFAMRHVAIVVCFTVLRWDTVNVKLLSSSANATNAHPRVNATRRAGITHVVIYARPAVRPVDQARHASLRGHARYVSKLEVMLRFVLRQLVVVHLQ